MKTNNLKKNFVWNTIGTLTYTFTSLFFMIIVTRINGVNEAGIFTFAFSLACMLQVIATYAGRTYQVTDIEEKIDDSSYIYHRIFTCIIMLAIASLFALIKGYTSFKSAIIILLVIYKIVDAFSESLYAIFQKKEDLYKVGISLFLRSFIGIICFFITNYFTQNLILSIIALIVINLCTLIFYDFINIKKYSFKMSKINFDKIKILFIDGFFIFLFTFLTQYVINATKYAIDDIMLEKYQTIFGIILMPATFMSLCSQLIIHPFLTKINQKIEKKDYLGFRKMILKICSIIFVLGMFIILICYFLGIPFLNLLYSINLKDFLNPFLIIMGGSILLALSFIISNALIAIRKNKIQTIIYIIAAVVTTIISYVLVEKFGILGASLSYFSTMLLLFILYLIIFLYECKKKINIK